MISWYSTKLSSKDDHMQTCAKRATRCCRLLAEPIPSSNEQPPLRCSLQGTRSYASVKKYPFHCQPNAEHEVIVQVADPCAATSQATRNCTSLPSPFYRRLGFNEYGLVCFYIFQIHNLVIDHMLPHRFGGLAADRLAAEIRPSNVTEK